LTLRPDNLEALTRSLRQANDTRTRVSGVDLSALDRVVEHSPEDMTVTAETGITLDALQRRLGARGQWLPVDPPFPGRRTLADILNDNLSGPRRFGHGTIREHLIGLSVALADGRVIRSGGRVVKNVAGYDLAKLFIGARGTLGVIVEATFKLRPAPEAEAFTRVDCASLAEAGQRIAALMDSPLTPVVLDLVGPVAREARPVVVAGFAGTPEEVEWQLVRAQELGFTGPATLDYEEAFWAAGTPARWSVAPSRLIEALESLGPAPFVARAGNGVIWHRGKVAAPAPTPVALMQRVKRAFDPNGVFADFTP
jgi:FAD/FMN-containing dehydrogenase